MLLANVSGSHEHLVGVRRVTTRSQRRDLRRHLAVAPYNCKSRVRDMVLRHPDFSVVIRCQADGMPCARWQQRCAATAVLDESQRQGDEFKRT